MITLLHGAVAEGRLLLWGEIPPRDGRGGRRRSGARRTPDHPFGSGPAPLREAVGNGMAEAPVRPVAVFLPSVGGRPLASSALIDAAPAPPGEAVLAPWLVSAIELPVAEAIEPLCACVGRKTLGFGLVVAEDLAFWGTALRFAGALVARHAYLPDLIERDEGFAARWRPVLAGRDAEAMARLAAAMPASGRAAALDPDKTPTVPAAEALTGFIEAAVDALVRGAPPAPGPCGPSKTKRKSPRSPDVAVDQRWLAALQASDPRVEGSSGELSQLADRVRDWRRPIATAFASPFRLCFRLEEPAGSELDDEIGGGTGGAWFVRYFLQSNRDPSLLVPVGEAWSPSRAAGALLKADGFDARSFLLLTLGQAARLDPMVGGSIGGRMPDGYETDGDGAVAFLTEKAALLEEAGFGVMLPAWWAAGRGTQLRLATRAVVRAPKMQSAGNLSLEDVLRFEWQVALGDETVLSRAELEALAQLKMPLVRVRGRWVLLNAQEIRQALSLLRRKTGTLTGRDLLRLALDPKPDREAGSPDIVEVEGGWIADLLARLTKRDAIAEIAMPKGFRGTLRPYQARGASWLRFLREWGLGACLADDMGLGKTVQTLVHLQREKEDAEAAKRKRPCVLLVCPTSVVGNWQREAAGFTPGLSLLVHHGTERERGAPFRKKALRHDLVVTSYSLLQRDAETLGAVPWTGVILDEAQNIKNPQTKQAKAARRLSSEYRVALTGTPVENNVGELWSVMEFLNPGLLGSEGAFKRRFFIPIQTGRDPAAIERLRALTAPFILRRLKTDPSVIADLPAKLEMKVACTLTREQASLYAAVVEDATAALEGADGIRRKGVVLATLSKLKQVCNHPAQFLGDNSAIPNRSGKLARLAEMLEEVLAVGERALVFTQFTEMGGIIKAHLEATFGREVLFLHGGVPKAQRDRMVERFRSDGESGPPVFLLSLKAGGTGLNLTSANHVFHYDRWWNPAVENQATDRAFRIGQRKRVQVHKFLCAGTVEEKIDEMIEQKKELAGAIVGAGEDWLTTLSTVELRELFALRDEAVGE